jgi:RNA polymerase sigma-70 factor, ECF subfamily
MRVVNAAILEQWNALSDEQVVADVLDGQTALFEVLMRRHNERLYRAARAIVRDESEAEDVMQQAYVNAYANLRQFNRRAQFSTWLTRIAINESLARVRRKQRYQPFDEDRPDVEAFMKRDIPLDPEREAASGELRVLLESAIDRLPDGAREVFVLRDVEGMSTADVGSALGISDDAVKTRLSRARAALRDELMERTRSSAPDAFRFYRPRCDRVVTRVLARITEASDTGAPTSSSMP